MKEVGSVRDFISNHYQNDNEKRFNIGLINGEYDEPLHQYIVDSCRSLEVLENLKVTGSRFIEDPNLIDMREYYMSRSYNSNKNEDKPKLIEMKDSLVGELEVDFQITIGDEVEHHTKKFLIPVPDEDGYYLLRGSRYMMQYQLVDASTYTRGSELIHKSSMPVTVDTESKSYTDTDGFVYDAPIYTILIFRNNVNAFYLYFAKFGVTQTLNYFGVNQLINVKPLGNENPDAVIFPLDKRLQVEVERTFFNKYQYVQSMTFMLISAIKDSVAKKISLEQLDDREYWTTALGSNRGKQTYNDYSRGRNTLILFERMLDESSKKKLKLHKENKRDIFATVRWQIQNFKELRKKDNMDLANKRIRRNEYIAALLTEKFSERLTRIISADNRARTFKKIKEIFNVSGDIIIQQLHKSGILRFDDRINDMDFFGKLRYTQKGPNSLGRTNTKTISTKHKGIHSSYMGLIDINVCGTSDPGSSGVLTPFAKTSGLFFNAENEPEDGVLDIVRERSEYFKNKNTSEIYINIDEGKDTIEDLRDMDYKIRNLTGKFKVYASPKPIVPVETPTDNDIVDEVDDELLEEGLEDELEEV